MTTPQQPTQQPTLQQLCLVVGLNTAGKPVSIYADFDSAAAEAAYRNAGPEFQDVVIYGKGTPARNSRKPAKEAAAAKLAQSEAKAREHSELNAKKTLAQGKADQIRRLTAEAEALQEEILKSTHIISHEATLAHKKSKK